MPDTGRAACLALHLSGKFLTDKTRRQLETAGSVLALTRVLLAQRTDQAMVEADNLLQSLDAECVLTLADADYPPLLREIDHAPFALFLRGNRSLLSGKMVSLVGTREPSTSGRLTAAQLSAHFISSGHTLVSGIARGIDAIVHHAALTGNGKTIAVLPNGFLHPYPLENRDLYMAAGASPNLLLLSEYLPDQKPQRHHFVRRNRLIAGLSPLTVVVEAGEKSGALITADFALREGREVAAVSDTRLSHNAGGLALIADGAHDLASLVSLPQSA
ncbi:MAG: DNA-protecting protein DprA [Leptospiraceae bacterium]|nr:DNA-protecting protein DprA [Leptospiraceae bacterium]